MNLFARISYLCSLIRLFMRKLLFVWLLGILLSASSFAQSLPAGSVAFIAIQGDHPIAFAIINTRPIPANTQISFTDNKWTGSRLLTNEGTVVWTSPDTVLPAGTIVKFRDGGAGTGMTIIGPGTVSGRIFFFLGMGDQILAYTGTAEEPSFIAGISTNYWRSPCDTISFFEFRTCLPAPLVNGQTAMCFVNVTTYNIDNGYFGVTPIEGVGPEILPLINNVNYWLLDNGESAGYNSWPDWSTGNTQPFASTIQFAQEQMTLTEGGPVGNVELKISVPQFAPQTVVLSVLHFPGVSSSDYSTSPPVSDQMTISIEIPANATSYILPVQALVDGFPELDENLTLAIGALSGGLVKGAKDAIAITIKNTDNENLSYIEFERDTVMITEGAGGKDVKLRIVPPVPPQYYVILDVQNGPGVSNDYISTPATSNHQILLGPTAPNTSEFSFNVLPVNDFQIEPDEFVRMTISVVTPAGLLTGNRSTMTLVIRDNDAVPQYLPPQVYINELAYFNSDFPDEFGQNDPWIELYNQDTADVNLSGYYISNDLNNPVKFKFPQLSSQLTIGAGQYFVLWADQQTTQGARHLNFKLTQNGGFVGLYAPDGELLIDGTYYSPQREGFSFGRIPDAQGEFNILHLPTPGAENTDSIPLILIPEPLGMSKQNIKVFPNPTQSKKFELQLTDLQHGALFPGVKLFDTAGREFSVSLHPGKNFNSRIVDVSSLHEGFYLIRCGNQPAVPLLIAP